MQASGSIPLPPMPLKKTGASIIAAPYWQGASKASAGAASTASNVAIWSICGELGWMDDPHEAGGERRAVTVNADFKTVDQNICPAANVGDFLAVKPCILRRARDRADERAFIRDYDRRHRTANSPARQPVGELSVRREIHPIETVLEEGLLAIDSTAVDERSRQHKAAAKMRDTILVETVELHRAVGRYDKRFVSVV